MASSKTSTNRGRPGSRDGGGGPEARGALRLRQGWRGNRRGEDRSILRLSSRPCWSFIVALRSIHEVT